MFSRDWKLREEGLNNIKNEISQGKFNKSLAFVNGMGVVRYTVGDKMA